MLAAVFLLAPVPRTEPPKPRVLTAADTSALAWRAVGPTTMGGRVADVALHPGDRHTFFVAFGHGGVWKTENGGLSLTPIFDKEGTSSVGSVVALPDPKDPKKTILWVGTGEGNGRNSSSWGDGVYRSDDGGKTWRNTGLKESRDVPRLAVDPANPDVVYAAALGRLWGPNAERGVYKTEDGGKTWRPSLRINEDTGAIDVVMDPKDPNTLYAAMYARRRTGWSFRSGGPEGGIYRTRDGGKKWTKLTKGLPAQTGRIGLDVSRSNPKVVMAVVESDEGGGRNIDDDRSRAGGVFRSEDGGETWSRVNALAPRAFYFSKIRLDPANDRNVWLLGWNLYQSKDGGRTFRQGISDKLHVDWHAMALDPRDPERIVAGSDGGVYQTRDGGKSWDHLNGIPVGLVYNVAVDGSTPYRILCGLQDNNSWLGPSRSNWADGDRAILPGDWLAIPGGDGFHCAFDPDDPNVVYAESQGAFVERIRLDGGGTVGLQPTPKEGETAYRFNWNSPFFPSRHAKGALYLGGNRIFRLDDRGDRWRAISPDLTTNDPVKAATTGSSAEAYCTVVALAESPKRAGELWAGTDDGLVWTTGDDGKEWRDVTPPQVKGRYVADLWASGEPGRCVAVVDGHRSDDLDPLVLSTEDGGKTWRDVTGDLPKGVPTRSVAVDPVNPALFYVGTETGIYASPTRGGTWVRLGTGLPTVPVHDIQFPPKARDVVIGTHGRSVWILDDVSALDALDVTKDLAVANPLPARPFLPLGHAGLDGDRPTGFANPPSGALIHYWLKESGETAKIRVEDAAGTTVAEFDGPAAAGINRARWDLRPKGDLALPNAGQDPGLLFVAPGAYRVFVKVGDREVSAPLTVGALPGQG